MKSKILLTLFLTAFLLSLSLASAITFTQNISSIGVTVSNSTIQSPNGNTTAPTIFLEEGQSIAVGYSINDQTVTFTATPNYYYVKLGKIYSGNAVISNGTANQTVPINILKTFCTDGAVNTSDLELEVDITNNGEGEDETNWLIFDDIEVEVKFKNNKDLDLDDVTIELGLFEKNSGSDVSDDLEWTSDDEEKADVGDVDKDEKAEHTFEFKVSGDIEPGDYLLMIKAYTDSGDVCLDSSDLSGEYFEEISIERESDDERQIVLDDISVEPSNSVCGGEVLVSAKAYNIGTEDQDAVKVILYNKELGLDMEYVITDFDMDDDAKPVEFTFSVPKNATEKTYVLSLYSMYDYDEDDDEEETYPDSAFGENSKIFKADLKVEGNCPGSQILNASLNASLSDETPKPRVGGQVIIEAKITNTGTNTTTYTIDVTGNSAWSQATIDPKTVTLNPGESDTVKIYLDVSKDAEAGEKEFTIKASYGTQATEQRVKLTLEKGFTTQAIVEYVKTNWFIYVIVLVNLIIIIAIIVVIAKMVSARKAAA